MDNEIAFDFHYLRQNKTKLRKKNQIELSPREIKKYVIRK